jgi:hypothetical protein
VKFFVDFLGVFSSEYRVGRFPPCTIAHSPPVENSSLRTLSTTYAVEVVPTVLRPIVSSYVCMCWGWGIFISSGVVRGTLEINSNWAWRLPFALQWIWPVPLFIVYLFAPESPWFLVRKGRYDEAKQSLQRLRSSEIGSLEEINRTLALLIHTINLEDQETAGASYAECFRGINRRRTEIVRRLDASFRSSHSCADHAIRSAALTEHGRLGRSNPVWKRHYRFCRRLVSPHADERKIEYRRTELDYVYSFQRAGLSATNAFNLNMVSPVVR